MYPLRAKQLPGFTLVELLVVVLIIGVLAAIALPRFLGQRTRSKNAAAQSAVRHALLAARSYYTQNSESYAGLDGVKLQGYESSLSGSEPTDGQVPGSSANPQDIWIGNGTNSNNPLASDSNGGNTVVLCSVSKGDTVYCVKDTGGVATYLQSTSSSASAAAGGSFSATGWSDSATGGSSAPNYTLLDNGFNSGSGSLGSPWTLRLNDGTATYDATNQGYSTATGTLSAKSAKLVSGSINAAIETPSLSSMNADGAEMRWWIYTSSSTSASQIASDTGSAGTFYVDLTAGGVLRTYCDRSNPPNTSGYATAGFHTIGSWTANTLYQFKVILNFTNKTYTVWRRTTITGSWTQLYKAGASTDIPMRSGTVTSVGLVNFTVGGGGTMWVDEVQYANAPID